MKRIETKGDIESLISNYENFLFDCDGVLWNGDILIENSIRTLEYLRNKSKSPLYKVIDKRIIFVTNNSTKSRTSYLQKFIRLGIQAQKREIFGSAYAAAIYLKQIVDFPNTKKVFVIGEQGIRDELDELGIRNFSLQVGVVLMGFDQKINYKKYCLAYQYIKNNQECLFIATNLDTTFPVQGGLMFPGTGALISPLIIATGVQPIVCGKPSSVLLDCIAKAFSITDFTQSIMIGDRLDTDILFGIKGSMSTLLVLSGIDKISTKNLGVSSEQDALGLDPRDRPQYIAKNIGVLSSD